MGGKARREERDSRRTRDDGEFRPGSLFAMAWMSTREGEGDWRVVEEERESIEWFQRGIKGMK